MPGKRDMVEPNEGDNRYVRRDDHGKFKESVDVGRSLSRDRKQHAQSESESGQGDRGDRSSSSGSSSFGRSSFGHSSSRGSSSGSSNR